MKFGSRIHASRQRTVITIKSIRSARTQRGGPPTGLIAPVAERKKLDVARFRNGLRENPPPFSSSLGESRPERQYSAGRANHRFFAERLRGGSCIAAS
jgi:hypothetical protein